MCSATIMPAGTPTTYQLIFINYHYQSFDSHFKSLTVFLSFFNILKKYTKNSYPFALSRGQLYFRYSKVTLSHQNIVFPPKRFLVLQWCYLSHCYVTNKKELLFLYLGISSKWFTMEESRTIFVLKVFVDLKRITEESV